MKAEPAQRHEIPAGAHLAGGRRIAKKPPRARKHPSLEFSDIDPAKWREYPEVLVESLWILGKRDSYGPHSAEYWGNFVPQIPHQLMRRYTKPGDVVLDMFSGLGTTMIECRRLGRNGLGIELSPEVAARSRELVDKAANPKRVRTSVLVADSTAPAVVARARRELSKAGSKAADLAILHPPYFDIIRFSKLPGDLSNAKDLDAFLLKFRGAVRNATALLKPGRFLGLVIGDKYAGGEWVPLGFECMDVCRKEGLSLKAINVKDMQGNERGKGKAENLWRFRALSQGFYLFKHEYVMVFQKPAAP